MTTKTQKIKRKVNRSRAGANLRGALRRASLMLLALFLAGGAGAQKLKPDFSPGEEIHYGAYYNWKFIWVNAGESTFRTDTIRTKRGLEWKLKAIANTYKAYDLVFTVRDTFETRLSYPGFEPHYFYRAVNHGGSSSQQSYTMKPKSGEINYYHRKDKDAAVRKAIPYQPDVYDLLSQAYLFRSYKFEKLKTDEKVFFPMLIDDKIGQFWFRYLGRDVVKTRNGRKFNCYKISVWLVEGESFPEGEFMTIWFTADRNHIPIMMETKIQIGYVKAIFIDSKSLTYPLNSEIH